MGNDNKLPSFPHLPLSFPLHNLTTPTFSNTCLNRIIFPSSFKNSIFAPELSITIHQTITPAAFVVGTIHPNYFSITVSFIIMKFTFIVGSIPPFVNSFATFPIIYVISLINIHLIISLFKPKTYS